MNTENTEGSESKGEETQPQEEQPQKKFLRRQRIGPWDVYARRPLTHRDIKNTRAITKLIVKGTLRKRI